VTQTRARARGSRPRREVGIPSPASEDYLAAIYALSDEGRTVIGARLAEHLGVAPPTVTETLRRLERDGLVRFGERHEVSLTDAGHALGEGVVRRHRLVERWLRDYLGLSASEAHRVAHRFEHGFSGDLEERLFLALGSPLTCPHGNPIPGSGARTSRNVYPLDRVEPGQTVVVDRITEGAEQDLDLLEQLERAGVWPGTSLVVDTVGGGSMTLRRDDMQFTIPAAAAALIWVQPPQT